jgi:hypothetical protein
MPAPIVFVSYASENTSWVVNFKQWLGRLGNAYVKDYQTGDNLPFGPLDEWLKTEISAAGAIVMIVSKDYITKKYTLREWWQALSEFNRGRLVFVPVMIDADAKAWWAEQKLQGNLSELGNDYAYADFTDGSGNALDINNSFGPITAVTRKIGELAGRIRKHLEDHELKGACPPAPVAKPAIVVLGHPVAMAPVKVGDNARGLIADLQGINLDPMIWKDGWRESSARQNSAALPQSSILFVQPLGPVEAGDHAENPGAIRKWIEDAVAADMPQSAARLPSITLVLWLPSNLRDAAFEAKLTGGRPDAKLVLRHDDPVALATWLNGSVGNNPLENVCSARPRRASRTGEFAQSAHRAPRRLLQNSQGGGAAASGTVVLLEHYVGRSA